MGNQFFIAPKTNSIQCARARSGVIDKQLFFAHSHPPVGQKTSLVKFKHKITNSANYTPAPAHLRGQQERALYIESDNGLWCLLSCCASTSMWLWCLLSCCASQRVQTCDLKTYLLYCTILILRKRIKSLIKKEYINIPAFASFCIVHGWVTVQGLRLTM